MTVSDTMNAPANPKTGLHRAISHNSNGNTTASGSNESQDPVGCVIAIQPIRARSESTPMASMASARDGGLRQTWPRPITSGATITIPTPSDKNHARQTSQYGAAVWNRVIVAAPPRAEAAAPRQAAAAKPSTRRRSSKANGRPNQRSINPATKTVSPALQKPLNSEVQMLLSLMRLGATVPRITPTTIAGEKRRFAMIKMPAAMPDAGQNTATSEGADSKASPNRAAR